MPRDLTYTLISVFCFYCLLKFESIKKLIQNVHQVCWWFREYHQYHLKYLNIGLVSSLTSSHIMLYKNVAQEYLFCNNNLQNLWFYKYWYSFYCTSSSGLIVLKKWRITCHWVFFFFASKFFYFLTSSHKVVKHKNYASLLFWIIIDVYTHKQFMILEMKKRNLVSLCS